MSSKKCCGTCKHFVVDTLQNIPNRGMCAVFAEFVVNPASANYCCTDMGNDCPEYVQRLDDSEELLVNDELAKSLRDRYLTDNTKMAYLVLRLLNDRNKMLSDLASFKKLAHLHEVIVNQLQEIEQTLGKALNYHKFANHTTCFTDTNDAITLARAVASKIDVVRELLINYGDHLSDCPMKTDVSSKCTCGFEDKMRLHV